MKICGFIEGEKTDDKKSIASENGKLKNDKQEEPSLPLQAENGILHLSEELIVLMFKFVGRGNYRSLVKTCKRFHSVYKERLLVDHLRYQLRLKDNRLKQKDGFIREQRNLLTLKYDLLRDQQTELQQQNELLQLKDFLLSEQQIDLTVLKHELGKFQHAYFSYYHPT